MATWENYQYQAPKKRLEEGSYRVFVKDVEEKTSASGKNMIVVSLQPNGYETVIKDYFVEGEYFNDKMSRFFDAFPEIQRGNFRFIEWIGAIGACKFKTDGDYLRVHYYLTPERAKNLPEWKGSVPEKQDVTSLEELGGTEITDDELPFWG